METGFLNPIHDEEHFSSTYYNQENGLDGTENMLFGEMIVPEIIDYDNLWHSVDDMGSPGQPGETSSSCAEDLQRLVFEWQNQLTYMQEPEVIKQILPVAEKTTQEVSAILSNSPPLATSLHDLLFPLDHEPSIEEGPNSNQTSMKEEYIPDGDRKVNPKILEENLVAAEIKFKEESPVENPEEESDEASGDVDVETVGEEVPLLLAGDLTSLLEQFEATERVNCEQLSPVVETPTSLGHSPVPVVPVPASAPHLPVLVVPASAPHSPVPVVPVPASAPHSPVLVVPASAPHSPVLATQASTPHTSVLAVPASAAHSPVLATQASAPHTSVLVEPASAPHSQEVVAPTYPLQPPVVVAPASPQPSLLLVPPSPPRPSTQTIRDALPPEVINRIKASRENHQKVISVIRAMPNKRTSKTATRMQDAGAALSRNKLLKLVTGGSNGESVQLDHDYCNNGSDSASNSSRSYYVSDSSEYPSQASTPDISYTRTSECYVNTMTQKLKGRPLVVDTGSRKDSGLESGENSDEDVAQPVNHVKSFSDIKSKVIYSNVPKLKTISVVNENGIVISSPVIQNSIPMVSVLKKNNIKVEKDKKAVSTSAISVGGCIPASIQNTESVLDISKNKKKKLNLEEYRVRREERDRIRSQESSRASSPVGVSCGTSPAQPDSTTASQEGVSKEKPLMHSVEVQTQTCEFIDLTSSSPEEHEKSRKNRKDKRNDLKHKSYRSRYASTSSSSSSVGSDRYHSHRRKRRSRSNKRRRTSVSRFWSRSRSRSSSSLSGSSRSRSRSRDRRQKWRSRSPRRHNSHHNNNRNFHRREARDQSWQRSRSPARPPVRIQDFDSQEKVRQIEERRVIYVGRIDEGTTKAELRMRFQKFGPIVDISIHFRERGDNYGFVTFAYKIDAYRAVEHGNDDPKLPRYDLCFGGRRAFCKQRYADLDGMATTVNNQYKSPIPQPRPSESFDLLLHEVKSQMRKRSSV